MEAEARRTRPKRSRQQPPHLDLDLAFTRKRLRLVVGRKKSSVRETAR
jgi:hypothetical protein